MKAVIITFDQAHYQNILVILDRLSCRGFTYWPDVQGRGSKTGEPHYGSHAWPTMNSAIMAVVDTSKIKPLMDGLRHLDNERPMLGLRAFVLPVEESV